MMWWLIDSGVLGDLAQLVLPKPSWPSGMLHVASDVAKEAAADKSGRRQQLLLHDAKDGQLSIREHRVSATSGAGIYLYEHLRSELAHATQDLGEHASIALARFLLPDATFVTKDKGAASPTLGRGSDWFWRESSMGPVKKSSR